MSHNYNARPKKESVVTSECLQTLEANIINNINSLKDETISLKVTVIKRLQEENERLYDKCQQLDNRAALIESSHDAFEQDSRRNNLVISDIPDSVQDSVVESTVTSILSDIDVNVESREVGYYHRIGKSNNGFKKTIIRFTSIARKHYLTESNRRKLILQNIQVAQRFLLMKT